MKIKLFRVKCFIVVSMICSLQISCRKIDLRTERDSAILKMATMLTGTDTPTVYNYVIINGDQWNTYKDSNFRIGVDAAFTDSITNQLIAVNGLSINSRNIIAKPDHTFDFGYSDSASGPAALAEGLALFGTNVRVKVTGTTTTDTLTQVIYMPKKIYKTPASLPIAAVNIANSLTLNWTPDPLCSWGNVLIKIWYNSASNRYLVDSALPAQDANLTFVVPDNGSYTISSTSLQTFQKKSFVNISLGRGTEIQKLLPVSHKRVFFFAISSVSSGNVYLSCPANWQNTTTPLRCQVNGNGLNTGYQEQEQKDMAPCSATYNQTRWIQVGMNTTACPLPVNISGSNTRTQPYNVKFTNNSTGANWTFRLNTNTSLPVFLGQIPVGNYAVLFFPAGPPITCTFSINGQSMSGTGANFPNVSINSAATASVH